jgi:hypothetical protein
LELASDFHSGYDSDGHFGCECEIVFCHEKGIWNGFLNDDDRVDLGMGFG